MKITFAAASLEILQAYFEIRNIAQTTVQTIHKEFVESCLKNETLQPTTHGITERQIHHSQDWTSNSYSQQLFRFVHASKP